jgi:hypothetical protein
VQKPVSRFAFQVHNLQRYSEAPTRGVGAGAGAGAGGGGWGASSGGGVAGAVGVGGRWDGPAGFEGSREGGQREQRGKREVSGTVCRLHHFFAHRSPPPPPKRKRRSKKENEYENKTIHELLSEPTKKKT